MSGSGNPFDPNQPDGSWYNPFSGGNGLAGTNGLGIDLSPKVGLFGSGYANWLKTQSAPDLIALGAPADFSTDGTGLPPSVTATANLPMHTNPAASLQQVLNFPDNDLGLPSPAGVPQRAAQLTVPNTPSPGDVLDEVARQPPFNMRDQALGEIRSRAENQVRMGAAAREALGPLSAVILPELGVPKMAEGVVSGMIDLYNNVANLGEEQRVKNASDEAVFNALNDSEKGQLQGRTIFPFGQGHVP